MLQLFRSFFKSRLGIVLTLGFLALVAVAFASMDVASTGLFGGVAAGERVAVVGERKIEGSELAANASSALNQVRQQDPTLTMAAFANGGGVQRVFEQMLGRAALAEFGRENGLRAGKRLVDSEIRRIPAFRDASGNFSEDAYRAALRQQGLSDAVVREDLAMGLFARQLITPLGRSPTLPASLSQRYAQLLRETRKGAIGLIPSAAYLPGDGPSDRQLQSYYQANRARYIRPERRVIRYAAFGEEAVSDLPAPTEAQIAARYQRDRADYQAQENRTFTQLVTASQADANAVAEAVRGGQSLVAAARARGLAASRLGPIDRAELAERISAAVAQAGFAAPQGAVADPARGELGWYVLRVDAIETLPGRSLAQMRGEISATLAEEQRSAALGDLTARIEQELDSGRSLAEVAGELGVELQRTGPVTAAGQVYGTSESVPPVLSAILATAFEMGEERPQLAVVEQGKRFLVFDVTDITASATAPLADIRDQVAQAWRRDQGFAAASQAATRIARRVAGGQSLADAMRAEEVALPPADPVDLNRQQIAQGGQVPPVLALLFSMAEGTVKRLAAPDNSGYFVVELEDITTPALDPEDPVVVAVGRQLQSVVGDEYVEQFITAVEKEVGIERNQAAVEAVIAQLAGQGN